MKTMCPRLRNATPLAHRRGLLPKKEVLACEFESRCDQVDCLKLEDPNFKPIFIRQSEAGKEPSQIQIFCNKIEKCLGVMRERG